MIPLVLALTLAVPTDYPTIQAAVNAAMPGDSVAVAAGVYHEHLTFPRSGEPGYPITVAVLPGAVLDGSDPALTLTWTHLGSPPIEAWMTHLPAPYFASNFNNPKVWRDSLHFYEFDSPTSVFTGIERTPYWRGPIAEGYFADWDGTLWVRSSTPPQTHTWQINPWAVAFYLRQRDYIRIEGFDVRFFTWGAWVTGSQHDEIRRCRFETTVAVEGHDMPDAMFPPADTVRQSAGNVIADNVAEDRHAGTWTYAMTKGTTMERAGVATEGGRDWTISGNRVRRYHDGIQPANADGVLVIWNLVTDVSDDGIEVDGDGRYAWVEGNEIGRCNNGISLAPIRLGPTVVRRNRIYGWNEFAIKGEAKDWTGPVFVEP